MLEQYRQQWECRGWCEEVRGKLAAGTLALEVLGLYTQKCLTNFATYFSFRYTNKFSNGCGGLS